MRMILEETQRAHLEWPTYGDEIRQVGKYNSLATAVRSLNRHLAAMHAACGNGWSHNHRLVYSNGAEVEDDAIWEELDRQEEERK